MTKELDIYMQDDGFYVGRRLKNGTMAKGAFRISEEDIVTMFANMFNAYCAKSGKTELGIQDTEGRIISVKRLPTELGG